MQHVTAFGLAEVITLNILAGVNGQAPTPQPDSLLAAGATPGALNGRSARSERALTATLALRREMQVAVLSRIPLLSDERSQLQQWRGRRVSAPSPTPDPVPAFEFVGEFQENVDGS